MAPCWGSTTPQTSWILVPLCAPTYWILALSKGLQIGAPQPLPPGTTQLFSAGPPSLQEEAAMKQDRLRSLEGSCGGQRKYRCLCIGMMFSCANKPKLVRAEGNSKHTLKRNLGSVFPLCFSIVFFIPTQMVWHFFSVSFSLRL